MLARLDHVASFIVNANRSIAAANAANTILTLAPAIPTSWVNLGPSGVPADATVASES